MTRDNWIAVSIGSCFGLWGWRGVATLALLIAIVFLLHGCAGSVESCERVRAAVNQRLVACNIPAVLRLDCASADYRDGDVDACIAAIKAAPCEDVEQTYFDKCDLFGQVP